MQFPPIKPDRALLWIALHPDGGVRARYQALRAVLKLCHLHPLDTTPCAELVIVEEAAFRQRIEEARAALGPRDTLHLIARTGDRLAVQTVLSPSAPGPSSRPPWLAD